MILLKWIKGWSQQWVLCQGPLVVVLLIVGDRYCLYHYFGANDGWLLLHQFYSATTDPNQQTCDLIKHNYSLFSLSIPKGVTSVPFISMKRTFFSRAINSITWSVSLNKKKRRGKRVISICCFCSAALLYLVPLKWSVLNLLSCLVFGIINPLVRTWMPISVSFVFESDK